MRFRRFSRIILTPRSQTFSRQVSARREAVARPLRRHIYGHGLPRRRKGSAARTPLARAMPLLQGAVALSSATCDCGKPHASVGVTYLRWRHKLGASAYRFQISASAAGFIDCDYIVNMVSSHTMHVLRISIRRYVNTNSISLNTAQCNSPKTMACALFMANYSSRADATNFSRRGRAFCRAFRRSASRRMRCHLCRRYDLMISRDIYVFVARLLKKLWAFDGFCCVAGAPISPPSLVAPAPPRRAAVAAPASWPPPPSFRFMRAYSARA